MPNCPHTMLRTTNAVFGGIPRTITFATHACVRLLLPLANNRNSTTTKPENAG